MTLGTQAFWKDASASAQILGHFSYLDSVPRSDRNFLFFLLCFTSENSALACEIVDTDTKKADFSENKGDAGLLAA